MTAIVACTLPSDALLHEYTARGYTDSFCTTLPFAATQAQYIDAFYTTWVFRLERWILAWAVERPSTDTQAAELARGDTTRFAAWDVEARRADQLLMCDLHERTRSWLMTQALADGGTRLYFGSAVVAITDGAGRARLGTAYRALLGFHKLYSRILLRACAARLRRGYDRMHSPR
jgi:hypothetical protein